MRGLIVYLPQRTQRAQSLLDYAVVGWVGAS
jgi:hypothetical protein